jgi:hypothetical protein
VMSWAQAVLLAEATATVRTAVRNEVMVVG